MMKLLYGFCSVVSADYQTPLFSALSPIHQDSLALKYLFSLGTSMSRMPDLLLEAAYVNMLCMILRVFLNYHVENKSLTVCSPF